MNRSAENTFLPKKLIFSATNNVFIVLPDRHTLRPFFSDGLMVKIVECDWLMNLRGTVYCFDKTNYYRRMKRNNDKCLFLITQ